MPFEIEWTDTALSHLKSLENIVAKRILKKLKFYSKNYPLRNIKKLKGEDGFRFRIGDFRIIFDKTGENKISILKVSHRKSIYKN